MKPVNLSFSHAWWQGVLGRGPWWQRVGLMVMLLVAVLGWAWLAWQHHVLGLEQARLGAELQLAQARVAVPVQRPVTPTIPAETLRQMDAVAARLNVPWSAVLDALERSVNPKVALLSLEPDARTGNVALTAEARSLDDLLTFAEVLGQDAAVAAVRMGQHDARAQDPGQPVRLTLSISPAPWRQ